MPHGAEWLVFLGSTALFALLPGPGVLYVLARALRGGRGEGVRSAFGTAIGGAGHVLAAAVGLSALLAASAQAYTVVKIVGIFYLGYLGIRTLLDRSHDLPTPERAAGRRDGAVGRGVLTELFNPKTALFFLAFLPHFVHADRAGTPLVFALLGAIVLTVGLAVDLGVAFGAGAIGERLAANPRWFARQRIASGTAMLGAGALLAVTERN